MEVLLDAIKFNHDSNSATTDALNIRKNETQFITVPEWQRDINVNPEDSPVAYALSETHGRTLTIKAKFSCTDPSLKALEVRAINERTDPFSTGTTGFDAFRKLLLRPLLPAVAGGVLGQVKNRFVSLNGGETDFETFEIQNARIWDAGVGVHDIKWHWQYRRDANDDWKYFATSEHRIYTVLSIPKLPWLPEQHDMSNTQLPWTEVLDYACRWAVTAKNCDDAAELITQQVFNLGRRGVRYHRKSHYTQIFLPGKIRKFDCQGFLCLLRDERCHGGLHFNCVDCACIVSTFANCVGCDLSQSSIEPLTQPTFALNQHIRIGSSVPQQGEFTYHETAWEGACREDDELFDACLQVDGDDDPSTFTPLLPTNIRFGRIGEMKYRYRLVPPGREQTCRPNPDSKVRRLVGYKARGESVRNNEKLLELLKPFYEYEAWAEPELKGGLLLINKYFINGNEFADWRVERVRYIETQGNSPFLESFWSSRKSGSAVMRLDAYQCPSQRDARDYLMELLSQFQIPDMTRQKDAELGNVAFASPLRDTVLFAIANLVFLVNNIGEEVVPLTDVAAQLHGKLTSVPAVPGAPMQRFRFTVEDAFVGDKVILEEEAPDPLERQRLHKFLSETGVMFLQEGRLVYQPVLPGLQTLNILASDAYDNSLFQQLQLNVRKVNI